MAKLKPKFTRIAQLKSAEDFLNYLSFLKAKFHLDFFVPKSLMAFSQDIYCKIQPQKLCSTYPSLQNDSLTKVLTVASPSPYYLILVNFQQQFKPSDHYLNPSTCQLDRYLS